ncbi:hypothetical protein [Nocardia asiatica]|uniref:hypothetical protein n=1 Tax=Nocardia asiatica TaxID=209252 RepID=UPI0002F60FE6|nr:hypothetical protein [Nocardia asiatica]
MGWEQAVAARLIPAEHGRMFERGLDAIYGLREKGYQAEVPYTASDGTQIRVDRYLPATPGQPAQNIEAKSGRIGKERDVNQLLAYREKLSRGEVVRYFMREAREDDISREAQTLMAQMKKEFPDRFFVLKANEKVFAKIMEAGARQHQKDRAQRLQDNLAKLPARETDPHRVEQLAKDYLLDLQRAKEEGREVGVEQLRLIENALRDMGAAELKIDLERAKEDRQALNLRFQASKEVEQYLEHIARNRDGDRTMAVNAVTHELLDREREALGEQSAALQAAIEQDKIEGKPLDLPELEKRHLALSNSLGAVRDVETKLFKDVVERDVADGLPREEAQQWLIGMRFVQDSRDADTKERLAAIEAEVERQAKLREAQQSAAEQVREADKERQAALRGLQQQGVPSHIVELLGAGQAEPPSAAVEREPDGSTPRVQRGHGYGQDRSRELRPER